LSLRGCSILFSLNKSENFESISDFIQFESHLESNGQVISVGNSTQVDFGFLSRLSITSEKSSGSCIIIACFSLSSQCNQGINSKGTNQ
jgi:hypothetical protein